METQMFEYRGGYMGSLWFDSPGRAKLGDLELRVMLDDEERSILSACSADDVRDATAAIGLLRWRSSPAQAIPKDLLDAFNAWRLERHDRMIAEMERYPERYGLTWNDPLRDPPALAWGAGRHVRGSGWTVTALADAIRREEGLGRADYEASLRRHPHYPNGSARVKWCYLPEIAKETWRRPHRAASIAA